MKLPQTLLAILIVIGLFFSSSIANNTNAQETSDQSPVQEITKSADQLGGQIITSKNYKAPQNADYALNNFMHAGLCTLAGISPVGQCVVNERQTDGTVQLKAYNIVPGNGALGGIGQTIASLYTKPTSSTEYIADIGKNLGVVKTAYAQNVTGSGAGIIQPIKNLYLFIQRVAYILFTLVFVIVGFMIMFRRKMNQQTVVNIQNALPKLVVGLLLITFSYFISALIVDTSFLGVQIVAQIFVENISTTKSAFGDAEAIKDLANESNILHLFGAAAWNGVGGNIGTIFGSIGQTLDSIPTEVIGTSGITGIIGAIIGLITFAIPGAIIGGALGAGVFGIIALLIPLILIVALVIQMFKLFWSLLNAYITILISTLFSPLIILYASIPGQGGKMDLWWKNLLASSLIFPAVFMGFLFVGAILGNPGEWKYSPPLFGGLNPVLLQIIVAYGILLGLPAIPKMVNDALGVKPIQGIPQAAMAGVGVGVAAARGAGKFATEKSPIGAKLKQRDQIRDLERRAAIGEQKAIDDLAQIMGNLRTRHTQAARNPWSMGNIGSSINNILLTGDRQGRLRSQNVEDAIRGSGTPATARRWWQFW